MAKELKFNATISDDKVLDTLMKMKSSARETDSAIDGIKQSADAATESLVKMGDAAETAMKKASRRYPPAAPAQTAPPSARASAPATPPYRCGR